MLKLAAMNALIPLSVMAVLVGVIAAAFIVMSIFIGPRKRHPVKDTPFECGIESEGYEKGSMPVRFYVLAMLFIIFDVELAFLFPWAVVYRSLGFFAFIEMLIFLAILIFGLVYVWKKGALKWV